MNTKLITLLLLATLAFGLPAISQEPTAKDDAATAAADAAPEAAKVAEPEAKTGASSEAAEATEPESEAAPAKKVKPKAAIEAKGGQDEEAAKDAPAPKTGKDAKIIPYPLKTCIVTDNDLKSMGDPVTIVHEGQEIKFCCAPCEKKFLKDPAKYLEKLSKATEEK